MLGNAFGWPHLLIILAVILLLFGATRLPALSKSLGQSIKVFRKEIKSDDTGSSDGATPGAAEGKRESGATDGASGGVSEGSTGRPADKS